MKQEQIFQSITELNQLILKGKALEGFEKYYSDEVAMQENENKPTIGKEANRERETAFFSAAADFHCKAKVLSVAIGKDTSMVEWHFDYTHSEWGKMNYKQVSVQRWQDGKIIQEKFYYPG